MDSPSLSFALGLLVLAYLSTFVVFAVIRIVTGVSIQRLGLSSLRRIAYSPRDGLKIDIRGLGLQLHRPTYSQPTWISLVISELKVTIDLELLQTKKEPENLNGSTNGVPRTPTKDKKAKPKSETWQKLTDLKEGLKRLQRVIPWFRYIDVHALKSSVALAGVGTVHVGSLLLAVDTRRHAIDRSRLFLYIRSRKREQQPAEWNVVVRGLLFEPAGKESVEIMDHGNINIHGFLQADIEGLRDASVFVKLGRVNIPVDDILEASAQLKIRSAPPSKYFMKPVAVREPSTPSTPMTPDTVDAHDDKTIGALAEAKGFVGSVLRGIKEVSFAISMLGISQRLEHVKPAGKPLYVSLSLKEMGMDLYRLEPNTPAHSMYFSRTDIAHQALLSAISLSVGIDDGMQNPERLVYVPMTTATVRTTLPSKMLQFAARDDPLDRNTNMFYANLVITSPSIDVNPQHLPLVMAAMESRGKSGTSVHKRGQRFFSRFLPKMSIKVSIQEPVIRVSLPPIEAVDSSKHPESVDFDLLIFAASTLSLDIESSHASDSGSKYYLSSDFRAQSYRMYYRSASKVRHDILINESISIKTELFATPDVQLFISANTKTISIFLVRPEITKGIRQILRQIKTDTRVDKLHKSTTESSSQNFLRKLPPWLQHLEFGVTDLNIEFAGLDKKLSDQPRGVALHLESWNAEYKTTRHEESGKNPFGSRKGVMRRSVSRQQGESQQPPFSLGGSHKKSQDKTDGRRVSAHLSGLEAFIIEGANAWEDEPFISLPKAEVALSASSDGHGPVLHVQVLVKTLLLQYSLFKHYCFAVAVVMLQMTFAAEESKDGSKDSADDPTLSSKSAHHLSDSDSTSEFTVLDVKVKFLQLKARLPGDPYMMFHAHELEGKHHRYLHPSVKAQVARLYAEAPKVRGAWNRIVSVKNARMDLREGKHKTHSGPARTERSFDFVSDAIRIGIPHQLVVHHIFDNFVNTLKATKQLHHRFMTRSDEYILGKEPEGPKNVPKVSIRTQVLLFELEDGAFEWKLGVIFRTGLIEQKQRLAGEEAFRLKERNLRSQGRTPNLGGRGSRSTGQPRGRSRVGVEDEEAEGENQSRRSASRSERTASKFNLRYDKDGRCGFSEESHTSVDDAWQRLQRYHAESWRKRVDRAMSHQHGQVSELRSLIWGMDTNVDEPDSDELILSIPKRPALMGIIISDVNIHIDKPSFSLDHLPDFMHKIGKGLPKDQQFALLVPLHAKFEMGECRMTLRDYPLPLLHIPAIKPGQSPRLPSWSLSTDFIIAEEFRGEESTRDLKVMVVPEGKLRPGQSGGFAVDVRRTVAPVKTYSEIKFDINTARDTRFTWGVSYQPAIQDMMQVIEGFTKPQIDPSERVGFWDKIRLSFHSRINVSWKGDGDVHLMLKGTRDPYVVTGFGAGLVMIWRNDVHWNIHESDDPTKFMTVDSGDYVLAIPDYSHYARQTPALTGQAAGSGFNHPWTGAFLKKVIMKLSGKVRWKAGIVFERNLENGQKTSQFEPHYNVTLRNPTHVKELKDKPTKYDAFRGFRSNQLHCSIAIAAPADRDWSKQDLGAATNYNSVHLSPRFFTHFFAWWSMFSGVMSLPTHQGPLFPGIEKSGKKFGRHIATIKYSLLLSPLFLSHIYKHKEAEEYASSEDEVAATGLKVRLTNFILDLHQRREEFVSDVKGLNKEVKTSGMRINQALLDLMEADIRAVSASITGTSHSAVRKASATKLAEFQQPNRSADLSAFNIPDNDFSWIDIDDFVEVDWTLPENADPQTDILPLAYAPRLTYRRQTDHNFTIKGETSRESSFGYEETHKCYIPIKQNTRGVQLHFIEQRLKTIEQLIDEHSRTVNEQELNCVRAQGDKSDLETRLKGLHTHTGILESKREFLTNLISELKAHLNDADSDAVLEAISNMDDPDPLSGTLNAEMNKTQTNLVDPSALGSHVSEFNNRFVVHNPMIKWTNSLRNIMLRYMHQVSQRRGFVYYTSRRAVKFILDIVEEQQAKKEATAEATRMESNKQSDILETPGSIDDDEEVQDRIQQLLDDANKFVSADDSDNIEPSRSKTAADKADQHLSDGFVPQNSYHVRLATPQIQLQSLKNTGAAVLLTARGITFKVYSIMDKDRVTDNVSGLVQRRLFADLENTQFFVTQKQNFSKEFFHMYSSLEYGTSAASSWPPWVPLEVMYDFDLCSFGSHGFSQVVQRTSASLRYDQYNKLRLKYNDSVSDNDGKPLTRETSLENAMDHIWVDFPRLRALCDSSQYFAMFLIAHDLLMYTEPLEKTRNERLEKIMLASDFSDLRGAPEMVVSLQDRIRQLNEIKTHFHVHEQYLDRKGWEDRITMDQDLANCENELFFMMKAITTSQRRNDDRTQGSQVTGLQRIYLSAKEIVWHLTKEANEPLAEFQLKQASFERTNNSDGSNLNSIEIGRVHGLNLLSKAIYPKILSAYSPQIHGDEFKMLRVNWHMLEAIAGIPVCDTFEVNLAPLEIQLEYETGKQLFEYIFPGKSNGSEGQSPFMVRHQPDPPEITDQGEIRANVNARVQSVKAAATDPAFDKNAPGSATGAGTLEHRLTPTHRLPDSKRASPRPSTEGQRPKSGLGIQLGESTFRKFFGQSTASAASFTGDAPPKAMKAQASNEDVSHTARGRSSITQVPDNEDAPSAESSAMLLEKEQPGGKRTRFSIQASQRSASRESRAGKAKSVMESGRKKSDDLSQMLNRASNYMTLAYVKLPSVVLCLSYKGKGSRNIEDVDNLVFQMPTLEYRNKTWSNLDLALALKKDVIRALIGHTGTIISNKFSHHKPGKNQQTKLRELASTSAILSSTSLDVSKIPRSPMSFVHGGRPSTSTSTDATTSMIARSPRVSDISDEERTRYHSGTGGSYASSLAPHPEGREVGESDDSDAEDSSARYGDAAEDLHVSMIRASSSHSHGHGDGEASDHGMRQTLQRHVSGLSKRATHLRTNLSPNTLAPPGQQRHGESTGASRNGSPMNMPSESIEADQNWDAKSARSAKSSGTTGTHRRTHALKNILKKATPGKG